eukprot:11841438-Alexandrium_andersonii.AAC.1
MVASTASYWWPPRTRRICGSAAIGQLLHVGCPQPRREEGPAPRPTRSRGTRESRAATARG